MRFAVAVSIAWVVCLAGRTDGGSVFQPIDFSADHNHRIHNNSGNSSQYPEGSVTLGGVPFEIPVGGSNAWHSHAASGGGGGTVSLDVAVNVFGVERVHTLINNYWGQPGPPSLARLEFIGSDGAFHAKDLIGNEDIRDFLQNVFTNSINGTTTTNVFTSAGGFNAQVRLDMQTIELPTDFLDETLLTVRLIDMGNVNVQRTWLAGLTVNAIPEPASAWLVLLLGVVFPAATRVRTA